MAISNLFLSVSQDVDQLALSCCTIDLSVTEVASRRVNYYIRYLPLKKEQLICRCSGVDCRVQCSSGVLLSDMSRTSRYSRKKLAPLDARIFHLPSVVINLMTLFSHLCSSVLPVRLVFMLCRGVSIADKMT